MKRMKATFMHSVRRFAPLLALVVMLCGAVTSCCKKEEVHDYSQRKVFIFYAAAFNNLSSTISEDINDMAACLPRKSQQDLYKVLVVSHTPSSFGSYGTPHPPVIYDYYLDGDGDPVRDTLYRFPESATSVDAATLTSALTYIKDKYPAKEYGLCLSSHGSGWVPDDYFTFPTYDEAKDSYWASRRREACAGVGASTEVEAPAGSVDPIVAEYFSANPKVKSFFALYTNKSTHYSTINIPEFAEAIPFKLNYILMDMCLMGGVEVACQLRNSADFIAFSSMEVMSDGFQYKNILDHLFYGPTTDLQAVCKDVYDYYVASSNPYSTISLVDCSKVQRVADVCASLVSAHRAQLDAIDFSKVQVYFRANRHFFYDLEDTFLKAGISDSEAASLKSALDECVTYKAATPWGVFKYFPINHFSGMSMFIPANGSEYLHNYYKSLAWNKATSLVK